MPAFSTIVLLVQPVDTATKIDSSAIDI